MRKAIMLLSLLAPLAAPAAAQNVRVNPKGVNVNATGATTVFLTFGGVTGLRAAEAVWCGELVPAAPDIGLRCDPATVYGSLPDRYDLSRASGAAGFTDIMSVPPSVARRAYQAAQRGVEPRFFYVRRFVSLTGGPDVFVDVTCRLTGGGARTPLALTDVRLAFRGESPVLFIAPGQRPPPVRAELSYNGTGRLKGRWEVVMPGDELPSSRDLLTEATLPAEERALQRRYTQLERFNVFLPPTGRITLPGPDVSRIPSRTEGIYLLLLRIEASDDREGDSDLGDAGAGSGIVHSGAVAGFPLPTLRYFVGAGDGVAGAGAATGALRQLLPVDGADLFSKGVLEFAWSELDRDLLYRLEIEDTAGRSVLAAVLQPRIGVYRAPPWLADTAGGGRLRWRVVAVDRTNGVVEETPWRSFMLSGGGR